MKQETINKAQATRIFTENAVLFFGGLTVRRSNLHQEREIRKEFLTMRKYPINSDVSGYVSLKEAYQWCNQSFYDGFIAALCETPEEFEAIEVSDRIAFACAAIDRNAILRRETP